MPHQPKTPGVVIAAAVLVFIYGGFALVCGACAGVALAANPNDPAGVKQILEKEAPGHTIVDLGNLGVSLLMGVLMILAGVGLLQLMPVARWTVFAIMAVKILQNIAYSAWTAIFIIPINQRIMAQQMQNQPPAPFDFGAMFSGGMWAGLIIGLLIPFIFIFIIVLLLSLKSARDAFSGNFQSAPSEERRPRRESYDDDDDYNPPKSPGDTGITDRP